jgi:hypothetical protein
MSPRRLFRQELGHEETLPDNALPESPVRGGLYQVHSGTQDRDRVPVRGQSPPVRGAVYAQGQPTRR